MARTKTPRKSKSTQNCPFCGASNTILYGKRNGKQRYKCKKCYSIFTENQMFGCGRSVKRAISILLNLVQEIDTFRAIKLKNTFKERNCKNIELINNMVFCSSFLNTDDYYKPNFAIDCSNPVLLICVDKYSTQGGINQVVFYPLPPKSDISSSRIITLNDTQTGNNRSLLKSYI